MPSKIQQILIVLTVLGLLASATASPEGSPFEDGPTLINVEFSGGSAAEFIRMLQRVAGDELNVISAPEVAEVTIPELVLRRVSPSSAVLLLDGRTMERPGRVVRLDVSSLPRVSGERPTFQVNAQVRTSTRGEIANVWTIRGLIDSGFSSDSVLSAIETALDALGSATKLDVRFHEDTGLLIAMGDEGQRGTIDMVVERLRDSIEVEQEIKQAQLELAFREELTALRAEIMHLQTINEQLQLTIAERDRELSRTREMLDDLLSETSRDGKRSGR